METIENRLKAVTNITREWSWECVCGKTHLFNRSVRLEPKDSETCVFVGDLDTHRLEVLFKLTKDPYDIEFYIIDEQDRLTHTINKRGLFKVAPVPLNNPNNLLH